MKKQISIVVLLLSLFSCQYLESLHSDSSLTREMETRFASEEIDLTDINNFEWDELLILGPYSMIEQTEKLFSLDLENIRENRIEYDDSIHLMVFIKNEKSVKIAEISREIGDFENLDQIIERNKAKFQKTREGKNKLLE